MPQKLNINLTNQGCFIQHMTVTEMLNTSPAALKSFKQKKILLIYINNITSRDPSPTDNMKISLL